MTDKKSKNKILENFYFTNLNYYILIFGIIVISIGYYLSSIEPWDSFASLVLAPIVLMVGHCLIIPIGIFYKKK